MILYGHSVQAKRRWKDFPRAYQLPSHCKRTYSSLALQATSSFLQSLCLLSQKKKIREWGKEGRSEWRGRKNSELLSILLRDHFCSSHHTVYSCGCRRLQEHAREGLSLDMCPSSLTDCNYASHVGWVHLGEFGLQNCKAYCHQLLVYRTYRVEACVCTIEGPWFNPC